MICDPAEKQAMVVEFMPLVRHVVNRICRFHAYQDADVDEMLSDGTIGLMDAVDKFDPDRGCKFETYATRRIWGQIKDGWRARDTVPRLMRQRKEAVPATHSLSNIAYCDEYRDYTFAEVLEDESAAGVGSHLEASDSIDNLVKGLRRRDRFIMTLYYVDGMTMREIGQTIGLQESRISQLIKECLAILRAELTAAA